MNSREYVYITITDKEGRVLEEYKVEYLGYAEDPDDTAVILRNAHDSGYGTEDK